jgi:hypothetical protein
MYTKHNALFCCPTFQQAYDNGVKSQHECTKDPVYVVEGANVPKIPNNGVSHCRKYEFQNERA